MFTGVCCISYFFALISIIGVGGVALVMGNPEYVLPNGSLRGGGNMAAVHLAHAVGGNLMLGFVAAVAFATIIAVVAGLTLSGAAAVSARHLRQHHLPRPGERAHRGAHLARGDAGAGAAGGGARDRVPPRRTSPT